MLSDNQHYNTKAHLDKFVHPESKHKVLYPYRRATGARKPTGTKQLGCAQHFFDQIDSETGRPTNKLDEARKKSETFLFSSGKQTPSSLSHCIYDDHFSPTLSDRFSLAAAAAFLYCSSPVQIHNSAMMSLQIQQQELFTLLRSDATRAKYQELYGDDAEVKLREAREHVLSGKLRLEVGEENWKQLGFTSFHVEAVLYTDLAQMGLTICTAHYKSFFITSDNPVIFTNASQPDSPGIRLPDAEIWFPVSYKRGLLWTNRHRDVRRTTFGHSSTREMNRRIVRWCYKDVYSPLPEDWIEAAMKANTFNPCYGHYRKLEDAISNHTVKIIKEDGSEAEMVDMLAVLRAGEKRNVVGF